MAIMEFVQRFQALELQRDTGNELIKDLLLYIDRTESHLLQENARLSQSLNDANLDLEDARRSRRELQQQLNVVSQRMGQLGMDNEGLKNRNPYVMVLIDGDETIFHEAIIKHGSEGGRIAAAALRDTTLEKLPDFGDEVQVIAKICANVMELGKRMKRDGCLEKENDLRDFIQGFSTGLSGFDFVDTGIEEERKEDKIRETTRFHLQNANLKHLVLGISNSSNYLPFVTEILRDDPDRRISFLEALPLSQELASTGAPITKLETMFRRTRLVDRLPTPRPTPSPAPATTTYAGVTSITPPASVTILLKSATKPPNKNGVPVGPSKPQPPPWIPGPRGLDEALHPSPSVLEKIKRRTSTNKLCNNHYLRGPCSKGSECIFEHEYKASEEEIVAIKWLTRLNPCVNGQDCEVPGCIYGHHCPSVNSAIDGEKGANGVPLNGKGATDKEDKVCAVYGCRFGREAHAPGVVVRFPRRWDKE